MIFFKRKTAISFALRCSVKNLFMKGAVLCFLCFFSFIVTSAQELISQQKSDRLFNAGIDLMGKNQFGAARENFSEYLIVTPANELKHVDAEYYVSFCALNLYHADAEQRGKQADTRCIQIARRTIGFRLAFIRLLSPPPCPPRTAARQRQRQQAGHHGTGAVPSGLVVRPGCPRQGQAPVGQGANGRWTMCCATNPSHSTGRPVAVGNTRGELRQKMF